MRQIALVLVSAMLLATACRQRETWQSSTMGAICSGNDGRESPGKRRISLWCASIIWLREFLTGSLHGIVYDLSQLIWLDTLGLGGIDGLHCKSACTRGQVWSDPRSFFRQARPLPLFRQRIYGTLTNSHAIKCVLLKLLHANFPHGRMLVD